MMEVTQRSVPSSLIMILQICSFCTNGILSYCPFLLTDMSFSLKAQSVSCNFWPGHNCLCDHNLILTNSKASLALLTSWLMQTNPGTIFFFFNVMTLYLYEMCGSHNQPAQSRKVPEKRHNGMKTIKKHEQIMFTHIFFTNVYNCRVSNQYTFEGLGFSVLWPL